ncbi:cytochrome c biogenesis protein CcsA [Curvibacter sp. APW13]|uniref:cytochrome C assembly family protein n=1 Tax=Curvibacter sp. APW13 TaxID=3077236 RepID=UPI0028DD52C1|nr:cytochrome c biogenesis protein CcsA [Curvibacter sp. APW13]MDT8989765.1 cytochrome c biogenesis protein CcsA [Curvibacter sp. APW13]
MILASASPASQLATLLAATCYAWPAIRGARTPDSVARRWVLIAWIAHAVALALGIGGGDARFGFAPALSMTVWLVAAVYAVESQFFPQIRTRWALSSVGVVAVLLAELFPGAHLSSNSSGWLALHLVLGVACYGLFAAAVMHAWLMGRAESSIRLAKDPHTGIPLLTLERLTYRLAGAGFGLLTLTLVAGWLFSDVLYGSGHAWVWNHKTVFAVLAWVVFATLLAGRRFFGWRGKRATRVLYAGATLLLLAYVGSRFVLEVVLGRTT